MKEINYNQLLEVFKRFESKFVNSEIIGTISHPFQINDFTYEEDNLSICFGNNNQEHYDFRISKDYIVKIELDSDPLIDYVKIKIKQDIFQTYLILICEYDIGGDFNE